MKGTLGRASAFAGQLALLALGVAACKSTPTQKASVAASASVAPSTAVAAGPKASASASQAAVAPQPAAAGTPVGETSEDARRLKTYWNAMARGRTASIKKNFPAALTAFNEALAVLPDDARAYAERGYAQLLAKNYALARQDFDLAVLRTDDPKLLAQIWFNYGLTAEQEERPEDARSAFARSNELNPTRAASEKLGGGTACTARVTRREDPEPSSRSVGAPGEATSGDFLQAFALMAEGRTPEKTPATAAEAQAMICAVGDCTLAAETGAPMRLKIGQDTMYGAVIAGKDKSLRLFPKLEVSKPGPCGTKDVITVRHQQPLHFRMELLQTVERFEGPNGSECTEAESAQCVRRCVPSTTWVEDWLFSASGDEPRLVVEQWAIPGGKTPWEVSVTGTDARILGSGCDIRWDLK